MAPWPETATRASVARQELTIGAVVGARGRGARARVTSTLTADVRAQAARAVRVGDAEARGAARAGNGLRGERGDARETGAGGLPVVDRHVAVGSAAPAALLVDEVTASAEGRGVAGRDLGRTVVRSSRPSARRGRPSGATVRGESD